MTFLGDAPFVRVADLAFVIQYAAAVSLGDAAETAAYYEHERDGRIVRKPRRLLADLVGLPAMAMYEDGAAFVQAYMRPI